MQELIQEYGRGILGCLIAMIVVALLVYACGCITAYMGYFADRLMGS